MLIIIALQPTIRGQSDNFGLKFGELSCRWSLYTVNGRVIPTWWLPRRPESNLSFPDPHQADFVPPNEPDVFLNLTMFICLNLTNLMHNMCNMRGHTGHELLRGRLLVSASDDAKRCLEHPGRTETKTSTDSIKLFWLLIFMVSHYIKCNFGLFVGQKLWLNK